MAEQVDVVPAEVGQVACPWCKLAAHLWLGEHKGHEKVPWESLSSMLRHHAIDSHQKINALLRQDDPRKVDEQCFVELRLWRGTRKDWTTPEQQAARWYEVCRIIARWMNVEVPDNLQPGWTQEWRRQALNEGQPVETVEHNIAAREDIRLQAQALANHINDKKTTHRRTISFLQQLLANTTSHAMRIRRQIRALNAQHEQDLHLLQESLRNTVLPDIPTPSPGLNYLDFQPQLHDQVMAPMSFMSFPTDTSMGSSDSRPQSLLDFGAPNSTNSTYSDLPDLDGDWTKHPYEDSGQDLAPSIGSDFYGSNIFPDDAMMNEIPFTDDLANPDYNPNLSFE